MKSVFEMKGAERAAALLVALGPEIASDILKHLDDESIERLTVEVSKLDRLSPAQREELIGEFLIDLRREMKSVSGGESKAHELLSEAFGSDKASEIMKRLSAGDVEREFAYLSELEPDVLLPLLKGQHPQILSAILSYLPPDTSAAILAALSAEEAKAVAIRMAKMTSVHPEALAEAARSIKAKHQELVRSSRSIPAGGINSLINILNHMDSTAEKNIMSDLDVHIPDMAAQIRERYFAFENLVNLTNKEIRILIDEINDDATIAKALKGAGDEMRFKFMRNMSRNRATDIIHDMDVMGPVPLSDVEYCRSRIMAIARGMHDNGTISLARDKEIMIE